MAKEYAKRYNNTRYKRGPKTGQLVKKPKPCVNCKKQK